MENKRYICPCCGEQTLEEDCAWSLETCPRCGWVRDPEASADPDEDVGGPNGLSLNEARLRWRKTGRKMIERVKFMDAPYEWKKKYLSRIKEAGGSLFRCPCCGEESLEDDYEESYDICLICGWERESLYERYPDEEIGGANGLIPLNAARAFWKETHQCIDNSFGDDPEWRRRWISGNSPESNHS